MDKKTIIIIASLVLVGVLIIGVSEYTQSKKNNINEITTSEFTTIDNNRKTSTTSVANSSEKHESSVYNNKNLKTNYNDLFRTYSLNKISIAFNPDGYYNIFDEQGNSFTGKFNACLINDALKKEYIKESELRKRGLIYKEIQPQNLYYIRCSYDTHVFGDNQEYYSFDIMREQYFEFLVYFKAEKNTTKYAINNIDDKLLSIDMRKPYF